MKYRVRTKEGELDYASFGQVEQAWLLGLIEPSDELLEEGRTKWRRADTLPLLVKARRRGDQVWLGTWFLWALFGILGGTVALVLIRQEQYLLGLLVAFVIGSMMFRVTMKAHRRSKPH